MLRLGESARHLLLGIIHLDVAAVQLLLFGRPKVILKPHHIPSPQLLLQSQLSAQDQLNSQPELPHHPPRLSARLLLLYGNTLPYCACPPVVGLACRHSSISLILHCLNYFFSLRGQKVKSVCSADSRAKRDLEVSANEFGVSGSD